MSWEVRHKSGRVLFVTGSKITADNREKMGWIVEEVKMTSRGKFEVEWGKETNNEGSGTKYGEYLKEVAWHFWQASREAIEIDLSNMHLLLCDQNDVVDELIKHGIKSKVNP